MAPPANFTPIHKLSSASGIVDVIGVVVDFIPPGPTRGTDWQCTFNIANEYSTFEGQRVKMFSKERAKFPPIRGTGDIVILRKISSKTYQGSNVLLSNWSTTWTIFYCADIPTEQPQTGKVHILSAVSKDAPAPTMNDMLYAIDLCNIKCREEWTSMTWTNPVAESNDETSNIVGAPAFAVAPTIEKFSLIKDIGANKFFDLVGQVVKMYPTGERLDLCITDYTENSLLFDYNAEHSDDQDGQEGDPYAYLSKTKQSKAWKGPSGKYTLTVTLFWPHSSFAQSKIRESDYVFLRNVHIKIGRDGSCRLEGVLHTDKKFPERIDVQKVYGETDDRVKDLLRRKIWFQRLEANRGKASEPSPAGNKRRLGEKHRDACKPQQKRPRLQERNPRPQEQASKNMSKILDEHSQARNPSAGNSIGRNLQKINPNIAYANRDQPTRLVADINCQEETHAYTTPQGNNIILPFQNLVFLSQVRVVDFYPPDLVNFAVRTTEFDCIHSDDEGDTSLPEDQVSSSPSLTSSSPVNPPEDSDIEIESRKRWTWFFTLILEDASDAASKGPEDRIAVHVADADAEFLLGLTADNLRRNEGLLRQLREKLFLLWGDLEERKIVHGQKIARPVLAEVDSNWNGNQESNAKSPNLRKQSKESKPILTVPFICCIKEYGIRVHGAWSRRFRMFGTTIQF